MALWINTVSISYRTWLFNTDLVNWINLNINEAGINRKKISWATYWATACHTLWLWRNKELYNGDMW
jgi:hypothetical protein